MTELPINQKEYLKKYLAIGKAPGEKKKKKKKHISTRVQIIDDDVVDTTITNNPLENDPIIIDEDAPQIVAIIDERPPSLRFDEKTKNPLWQPIGPVGGVNPGEQKQMIKGFKIEPKTNDKPLVRADKSPPRRKKKKRDDYSPPQNSRREESPVRDVVVKEERQSVPRSVENSPINLDDENDDSLPRRDGEIDDNSPPRRTRGDDNSPPRRSRWGDDNSPPRRIKQEDFSPPRRNRDDNSPSRSSRMDDNSPPRRNDDDNSPPRRNRADDDNSPPRRNRKSNIDRNKSRSQIDDISPPRKRRLEGDSSTSRKRYDFSPKRSKRDEFSSPRGRKYDNSPPRRSRPSETPPRKRDDRRNARDGTPDDSPPRKSNREDRSRTEGNNKNDQRRSKKMEKTLDGKAAGLQNAHELIEETRNFHLREDQLFKSLSKDVSGETATTVHRERRTGKIRNLEEEEERQRKKREEEEKNKAKYERWGRGVAQVESREQQIKEQLHEMSKPLARYADDEDLEKYLKEQEREGDPMLAYIRKKKRKKAADAGEVAKPLFEGQFMPNRYGIRPGHRWDGVDRSSGYEKKWFEVQNEKKALEEDSYKWSTEDM